MGQYMNVFSHVSQVAEEKERAKEYEFKLLPSRPWPFPPVSEMVLTGGPGCVVCGKSPCILKTLNDRELQASRDREKSGA